MNIQLNIYKTFSNDDTNSINEDIKQEIFPSTPHIFNPLALHLHGKLFSFYRIIHFNEVSRI